MAASHIVTRPLLQLSLQQGFLEAALSPTRNTLTSPIRSPPPLHGFSQRLQPLSPTISSQARVLSPITCNAVSINGIAVPAAVDQSCPPNSETEGLRGASDGLLSAGQLHTIAASQENAVSAEAVASAHILGAAVALLNSAPDDAGLFREEQASQDARDRTDQQESTLEIMLVSQVREGQATLEDNERGTGAQAVTPGVGGASASLPWWLTAERQSGPSGQSEGASDPSWWAQQVELARAQERAQETRALHQSLQQNQGPDATYALEGADPLLGVATTSSGEKVGGQAWWSQLTKVPTADWLHLQQGAATPDGGLETGVHTPFQGEGDAEDLLSVEGRKMRNVPQKPLMGTKVLASQEMEVADDTDESIKGVIVETPRVELTQAKDSLVQGPNTAVTDQVYRIGVQSSLHRLQSGSFQALSLAGSPTPQSFQGDQPSPSQTIVIIESPAQSAGLSVLLEERPTITDQVNANLQVGLAVSSATLAPTQSSAALFDSSTSNKVWPVAPESQASALGSSPKVEVSKGLEWSTVEEAKARLETIKAWRNRRAATPPHSAPVASARSVLPLHQPSSAPLRIRPSLTSKVTAATSANPARVPDPTIWKTLQELEWASEDTSDTFGRTSVAVHLAERHDATHS